MTELRILTVRQPWAWAIIHGGKDVENRVRNIAGDYRGGVAIHAAKADDPEAWRGLAHTSLPTWGRAMESPLSLASGAILGVVDLVGTHHARDPLFGCEHVEPIEGTPLARSTFCSPWAEAGAHHLELANPRPLAEPIPFKGALGLRRLDGDTTAAVWSQTGA